MHLNILSLIYYHEELRTLLSSVKVKPKILAVSESRIIQSLFNISLPNYTYEHSTTEATTGGAFLYIKKYLINKTRQNTNI